MRDDPLNPVVEGLGRLLLWERLGEGTTEDHRGVESGPLSCVETLGELEGVLVGAADAVCDALLPCSDGCRVEVMDLAVEPAGEASSGWLFGGRPQRAAVVVGYAVCRAPDDDRVAELGGEDLTEPRQRLGERRAAAYLVGERSDLVGSRDEIPRPLRMLPNLGRDAQ